MTLAVPLGLLVEACTGSEGAPTRGTIAFLTGTGPHGNLQYVTIDQVAAMKPDGSGQRTLANGQDINNSGSPLRWSPDGKKLAFTMQTGGRPARIYVVNADGSGLRRLTGPKYEDDRNPAWSPDGQKLAYDARGDGWNEIYIVNADGSDERRLTAGSYSTGSSRLDGGNAWSPDGRKIAFTDRDGRVVVVNPDGSGRRRLTRRAAASGGASWSPNGREIAFVNDREISVVHADGSGLRRLVSQGGLPVWSPDALKLAFDTLNGAVYVVNSDGSGLRKVGRMARWPTWSPDGNKIAFTSYRDGNADLYVVNADGSGERRLTHSKLEETNPVWSPAG